MHSPCPRARPQPRPGSCGHLISAHSRPSRTCPSGGLELQSPTKTLGGPQHVALGYDRWGQGLSFGSPPTSPPADPGHQTGWEAGRSQWPPAQSIAGIRVSLGARLCPSRSVHAGIMAPTLPGRALTLLSFFSFFFFFNKQKGWESPHCPPRGRPSPPGPPHPPILEGICVHDK